MWNMMKCFMSEVNMLSIDKVCCKANIKDCDYISEIKIWNTVQNDFNTKYTANNKRKILMENSLQPHVIFEYPSESKECTLLKIHQ